MSDAAFEPRRAELLRIFRHSAEGGASARSEGQHVELRSEDGKTLAIAVLDDRGTPKLCGKPAIVRRIAKEIAHASYDSAGLLRPTLCAFVFMTLVLAVQLVVEGKPSLESSALLWLLTPLAYATSFFVAFGLRGNAVLLLLACAAAFVVVGAAALAVTPYSANLLPLSLLILAVLLAPCLLFALLGRWLRILRDSDRIASGA